MQLDAKKSKTGNANSISISVPPTRSDVLHACDVMEVKIVCQFSLLIFFNAIYNFLDKFLFIFKDLSIAYGFNKIPETIPATKTEGRRQPLNLFSDLVRLQVTSGD